MLCIFGIIYFIISAEVEQRQFEEAPRSGSPTAAADDNKILAVMQNDRHLTIKEIADIDWSTLLTQQFQGG